MELVAFYIMATIVVVSAVAVIASKNPVHSVLWLILAFFTSAGLLVLIGAEFLAMLLVVVYVGAVAVLFLFVVMMLDVDFAELKQGFLSYAFYGVLIGMAFLAEIAMATFARAAGTDTFDPSPGAETNAEAIGKVMYTEYLLLFQLSGLILLVAMIGAIVLTLRHKPHVKRQNIARQTARRRGDATRHIDVKSGEGL